MQNIEIKAICRDLREASKIANELKTGSVSELHQVDTYYETREGRLKLREINDSSAELIPYYKDYSYGPMKSEYSVLPVNDKVGLKNVLNKILGEIIVIDKKRVVFLINNVRVHIDSVKGLGSFIEFEAVYEESSLEDKEREVEKVKALQSKFGIKEGDLLDKSYIDYFLSTESKMITKNLKALFYFTNKTLSILEVERVDVEKSESPDKRYFWFLFNSKEKGEMKLQRLNFVSMGSDADYQYRKFEGNKDLKFSLEGAEFKDCDTADFLDQKHSMFIEDDLKDALVYYFSV